MTYKLAKYFQHAWRTSKWVLGFLTKWLMDRSAISAPISSPMAMRAMPSTARDWWAPGSSREPGSGLSAFFPPLSFSSALPFPLEPEEKEMMDHQQESDFRHCTHTQKQTGWWFWSSFFLSFSLLFPKVLTAQVQQGLDLEHIPSACSQWRQKTTLDNHTH